MKSDTKYWYFTLVCVDLTTTISPDSHSQLYQGCHGTYYFPWYGPSERVIAQVPAQQQKRIYECQIAQGGHS